MYDLMVWSIEIRIAWILKFVAMQTFEKYKYAASFKKPAIIVDVGNLEINKLTSNNAMQNK